jgi:Ca2+-binding EF-hand superfamily protein
VRVETLSDGDLEIALGDIRLEFHAEGGEHAAENAKRYYAGQFRAADADNNKYLEKSELKDHGPFVSLFEAMDRDGDGKLYMNEVDAFVDRQTQAARSQMVLSVSDQGRSIFSIVDQNRDRHLGVREIRGAAARASSWDHDRDGRIRSEEIPHYYQLTIGRGQITAVGMPSFRSAAMASAAVKPSAAGPNWFRKMDRNRDGDISRREFLGPRADFDRLDRDGDGLIDVAEAARAVAKTKQTAAR